MNNLIVIRFIVCWFQLLFSYFFFKLGVWRSSLSRSWPPNTTVRQNVHPSCVIKFIIVLYQCFVILFGLIRRSLNTLSLRPLTRLVTLTLNLLLSELLHLIGCWWRRRESWSNFLFILNSLFLLRRLLKTKIDLVSVELLKFIIQVFWHLFFRPWRLLLLLENNLVLRDYLRLLPLSLIDFFFFIFLFLQTCFEVNHLILVIFISFASWLFILSSRPCRATRSNLIVLTYWSQHDVWVATEFGTGIDSFLHISILIWEFLYFLFNGILHEVLRSFLLLSFWWSLIGILNIIVLLILHLFLISLHSDHSSLLLINWLLLLLSLLLKLRWSLHTNALSLLLELRYHLFLLDHQVGRPIVRISLSTSRICKVVLHNYPSFSLSLNRACTRCYLNLFLTINHKVLSLLHTHLMSFETILC